MKLQTTLPVRGMSCGHCEGRVVSALGAIPGVIRAEASAAKGSAVVHHRAEVKPAALAAAIAAIGYEAEAADAVSEPDPEPEPEPERSRAPPPGPGAVAVTPEPELSATVRLDIGGMSCASCVGGVEAALRALPGVQDATVNLLLARADVRYDPLLQDPTALVAAVVALGYQAAVAPRGLRPPPAPPPNQRRELLRIAWTLTVGVLTMVIAMPLMADHDDPAMALLHPIAAALGSAWPALFAVDPEALRWTLAVLTTSVVLGSGRQTFLLAAAALRRRQADMHVLVALGVGAAWVASLLATAAPAWLERRGVSAAGWYDAVPWVLGLTALGRWLEEAAKRRTTAALDALAALQPPTAHVQRQNTTVDVALDDVAAGDTLLIRPGETVPVDAVVQSGVSALDVALLTGESVPVPVQPGARIFGGTRNGAGALTVRAVAVGADSAVARIVQMVSDAQTARPELQRLADRVAARFVPAVLVLAALTVMCWCLFGTQYRLEHGFSSAIAVLVIACPCAMGLAVPTAVMVAIGRAAQLGILVRSGTALERGRDVTAIVLDKTGTLTLGQPQLVAVTASPGAPPEWLAWLVAAQRQSDHPLARAIQRWADGQNLPSIHIEQLQETAGQGVKCQVGTHSFAAGRPDWLASAGVDLDPIAPWLAQAEAAAHSVVVVAVDGRAAAVLAFEDAVRPTTAAALARLRALGLHICIASGDRPAVVAQLARQLGVTDVLAAATPQSKLALIARLRAAGHVVAMVGDGINDAPALAAADLGIAMGQGADIAAAASDLVLLRADLHAVGDALLLSRAAVRNIRQNLAWAFGYNLLGLPLAAGALYPWTGWLLSPAFASLAMALSSVSVVLNALRLRGFESDRSQRVEERKGRFHVLSAHRVRP